MAALSFVLLQLALAAAALAIQPYLDPKNRAARADWLAVLALAAFAALGVAGLELSLAVTARVIAGNVLIALLLGVGLFAAPVAGACVLSGATLLGALWNWPVRRLAGAESTALAPGGVGAAPMPDNLAIYLLFAVIAALAVSGLSLRRLLRCAALTRAAAASLAIAAAATPPAVLTVVWMKTAAFATSLPFALIASIMAAGGVLLVARLRGAVEPDAAKGTAGHGGARHVHGPHVELATGALACATVATLALGLIFALDKGMLTVALALMAPAIAWVAVHLPLPALRYAVAGVGVVVAARLIANPAIAAEGGVGAVPVFNWLLWGYGAPALSFAIAARVLARQGRDRITALCESLAIAFTTLLAVFEIRHALHDGDAFAAGSSHMEAGLLAVCGLLLALGLSRLHRGRADPVYWIAASALSLASFVVIAAGLLVIHNPLNGHEQIVGGPLFNSLIPAYLLPGLLAGLLGFSTRAQWPRWRTLLAAGLSLTLLATYLLLEIRRLFQGPDVAIDRGAGNAEWLTYTAALLVLGGVLLAWGLARKRRLLRQVSAIFIIAAVLKAFLSDMASLDGVWRALSFIGLGLALIGVARAYQRLLAPAERPPDNSA
ncbi:hypothetical protein OSTOST_13814 [Ostertagia ostertagi]